MEPRTVYLGWAGFLALMSAVACSDGGTTGPEPGIEERLQRTLEEEFAETGGKGFSVAVLLPGRPVWTGTVGVSYGNVPITRRSVFGAGSITKTFTALTILRMAEDGLLSLILIRDVMLQSGRAARLCWLGKSQRKHLPRPPN